ncbi:hypothetical protein [Hoeflea sp.]|uniref:hypothetical protein n=1 Tax=Hoeflea sp. TaxID=1940281 RepID=UPI003B51E1FF
MTLSKAWQIDRKWKAGGYVSLVQGKCVLTSEAFPGVETEHGFQIDISNSEISDETDDEAILSAVQAFMAPHLEGAEGSHYAELQFRHSVENGTEVDIQVTEQMVIQERQRRLALGFDYDFGDARGVHHIGTTPADLAGWDEVTKFSQAALAISQDPDISIVTDTGPAIVTATEWQSILLAAAAHRQPIFAASFALQASDPIPANFADDTHWP